MRAGLLLGAAWAAVLSAALFAARTHLARLFSDDPDVIQTVVECVPWLITMSCFGFATVSRLRGRHACFLSLAGLTSGEGCSLGPVLCLLKALFPVSHSDTKQPTQ